MCLPGHDRRPSEVYEVFELLAAVTSRITAKARWPAAVVTGLRPISTGNVVASLRSPTSRLARVKSWVPSRKWPVGCGGPPASRLPGPGARPSGRAARRVASRTSPPAVGWPARARRRRPPGATPSSRASTRLRASAEVMAAPGLLQIDRLPSAPSVPGSNKRGSAWSSALTLAGLGTRPGTAVGALTAWAAFQGGGRIDRQFDRGRCS